MALLCNHPDAACCTVLYVASGIIFKQRELQLTAAAVMSIGTRPNAESAHA